MEIIKTWPAFMPPKKVLQIFTHHWPDDKFFFTLGRGKPQHKIEKLWFTHRGRVVGHFDVIAVVQNDGGLPRLRRLDGEPSEWQIKPDRFVAVCSPPVHLLKEKVYFEGFRGWRYFDLETYRTTPDARMRL